MAIYFCFAVALSYDVVDRFFGTIFDMVCTPAGLARRLCLKSDIAPLVLWSLKSAADK